MSMDGLHRVLGDPVATRGRHGGCGRHRVDQHGRLVRWFLGPRRVRLDQDVDRQHAYGSGRHGVHRDGLGHSDLDGQADACEKAGLEIAPSHEHECAPHPDESRALSRTSSWRVNNMKILIAGFQHETNTFAPTKASYTSFIQGEGFPPMARGVEVMALRDVNVPIGGFINAAQACGHDLLPVIWAGASASAHVTSDAFERIAGEILEAVAQGGFDAIYLDLHGAMVTEQFHDGEGEILARVRRIVGDQLPVVVSLDLHANVTERMVKHASALVAYRTYPHVDMAETGERAARILERLVADGRPLYCALRRAPFLIPVNGMCTLVQPARDMYGLLASLEDDSVVSLSFAPGFPAADFPECGPTIWAYSFSKAA